MAVTHYDLTATFTDLLGDAYSTTSAKVVAWIETNVATAEGIIDEVANLVMLGTSRQVADTSGLVTWTDLVGSDSDAADINLADGTLQYRVSAEYVNAATRRRETWRSGWFSLTADTDLADVVAEQYAPAEWQTAFMEDAQALLDAQIALSGIDDTDSAVAGLVSDGLLGPLTQAALSAKYERVRVAALQGVPAYIFGHSFGNGTTAADTGSHALEIVASKNLTLPVTNLAASGARMDQIQAAVFAGYVPNSRGLVMLAGGHRNDQNAYGNTDAGRNTTREAFRGLLAWITSRQAVGSGTSLLYGSGWSSGAASAAGSYYDVAFNGTSVWLTWAAVTGAGSTLTVKNTAGTTLATITTGGYGNAFTGVTKIGGLGAGDHTLRVTLTTGSTTMPSIGAALIPNPTPPLFLWELEPPYNLADPANPVSVTYQTATQSALTDFDTSRIIVVDYPPTWNAATCTVSDGVHPNQLGQTLIANHAQDLMLDAPITHMQGLNWLVGTLADNSAYTNPTAAYTSPGATIPAAPVITVTTGTQLNISWTIPDDGGASVSSYDYQIRLTSGVDADYATTAVSAATLSALIQTGLTNGSNYTVRVRAVNSVGNGAWSTVGTANAGAAVTTHSADTFTGADGALGTSSTGGYTWTALSGSTFVRESNRMKCTGQTTGSPSICYLDDTVSLGTVSAELWGSSSQQQGISAFGSSTGSYVMYWSGSAWNVKRRATNSYAALTTTVVNTPPTTFTPGDVATIVRKNSSGDFLFKVNGITIWSATEATILGGTRHGCWASSAVPTDTPSYDNFVHTSALV